MMSSTALIARPAARNNGLNMPVSAYTGQINGHVTHAEGGAVTNGQANHLPTLVSELPLPIEHQLWEMLDERDYIWKELAMETLGILDYTGHLHRGMNSPSQQILHRWYAQNPTVDVLFCILSKMHHQRAMKLLEPYTSPKYRHLLKPTSRAAASASAANYSEQAGHENSLNSIASSSSDVNRLKAVTDGQQKSFHFHPKYEEESAAIANGECSNRNALYACPIAGESIKSIIDNNAWPQDGTKGILTSRELTVPKEMNFTKELNLESRTQPNYAAELQSSQPPQFERTFSEESRTAVDTLEAATRVCGPPDSIADLQWPPDSNHWREEFATSYCTPTTNEEVFSASFQSQASNTSTEGSSSSISIRFASGSSNESLSSSSELSAKRKNSGGASSSMKHAKDPYFGLGFLLEKKKPQKKH